MDGRVAALAVAIATILGIVPSSATFRKTPPTLPIALLLAEGDAFTGETHYRDSPLSTLHETIGTPHALLLTVVCVDLGHGLYGSLSGPGAF